MAVRAGNGEEINFFETGYIMIGNKRYDVEEISINQSRDMNPYHVASQRDPIAQRPGRNKIDFSFKRAYPMDKNKIIKCPTCGCSSYTKNGSSGRGNNKKPAYKCKKCGKKFTQSLTRTEKRLYSLFENVVKKEVFGNCTLKEFLQSSFLRKRYPKQALPLPAA